MGHAGDCVCRARVRCRSLARSRRRQRRRAVPSRPRAEALCVRRPPRPLGGRVRGWRPAPWLCLSALARLPCSCRKGRRSESDPGDVARAECDRSGCVRGGLRGRARIVPLGVAGSCGADGDSHRCRACTGARRVVRAAQPARDARSPRARRRGVDALLPLPAASGLGARPLARSDRRGGAARAHQHRRFPRCPAARFRSCSRAADPLGCAQLGHGSRRALPAGGCGAGVAPASGSRDEVTLAAEE